jgi:hypothetical protein
MASVIHLTQSLLQVSEIASLAVNHAADGISKLGDVLNEEGNSWTSPEDRAELYLDKGSQSGSSGGNQFDYQAFLDLAG